MINIFADIVDRLPKHETKVYGQRTLDKINKVIVHHSATATGSALAFANYHINERDWPGIGYHFVIDAYGLPQQTNNLSTVSYHTSGQNTSSIGICLVGNFDEQTPSEEQIRGLVKTIKMLKQLGYVFEIHGHREYSSKSCPGDNIDIDKIRAQV